jgi:hypothetical protein
MPYGFQSRSIPSSRAATIQNVAGAIGYGWNRSNTSYSHYLAPLETHALPLRRRTLDGGAHWCLASPTATASSASYRLASYCNSITNRGLWCC